MNMENIFQSMQDGMHEHVAKLLIEKKFGGKIPATITPAECYELMREYNYYLEQMLKNWAKMYQDLANTVPAATVQLDPPPSR